MLTKVTAMARVQNNGLLKTGMRGFVAPSRELIDQLKSKGIKNPNIVWNPSYDLLLQFTQYL